MYREKLGLSYTAGGNGKWCNYFQKQFSSFVIREYKETQDLRVIDMLIAWITVMVSYAYTYVKTIKLYTSHMYSFPNLSCWGGKALL